ncbi:MAG: alpha-amylase [Anaerolineae bacterium]|nr:alpha-amylase [Promineifilum sp.]MCZ2113286.1 alpha-amylase [Anaerolineae bacterium]
MSPAARPVRAEQKVSGIVLPPRPAIYEINTRLWLRELSRQYGRPITLANVPGEVWDAIAGFRFDAVWLMGVWQPSPAGLAIVLARQSWLALCSAALPDMRPEDIAGSPYCVRNYETDQALGGRDGLAKARAELAERGMALILDFVPNHVAFDHPWLDSHPDYFIHGTADELAAAPEEFFKTGDQIIARGREPSFASWPDVAQLNAFNPDLRAAVVETLLDIAGQADGVRCDMAMLMVTEVFTRTWGERAGPPPKEEYWREIIPAVREQYPDFRFIAEVYWDMEWQIQQQGFDFCYDKLLYDRLIHAPAASVREHLSADITYQDHLLRFIENHDEPRAASLFRAGRALTAAVATYTLPGAKLFYQGQFEGYTTHIPVFLTRRPDEPPDRALFAFYRRLVNEIQKPALREGHWLLCALNGWPDNTSYNNLAAWCWQAGDDRRVIVVNLSGSTSQARVQLPWPDLAGQNWLFVDVMDETTYEWNGDEVLNMGLYVELAPWGHHFFAVR